MNPPLAPRQSNSGQRMYRVESQAPCLPPSLLPSLSAGKEEQTHGVDALDALGQQLADRELLDLVGLHLAFRHPARPRWSK